MTVADYRAKESYVHEGWDVARRRGHVYRTLFDDHANALCGAAALFLGANAGSTVAFLRADYAPRLVVGLDGNGEALRRGDGPRVRAWVPPLPFRDGAFDVVLALDFLEHLYDADLAALPAEVARVLRPGGRAVAFSPRWDAAAPSPVARDAAHVQRFVVAADVSGPWLGKGFARIDLEACRRRNPDGHGGPHDAWLLVATRRA